MNEPRIKPANAPPSSTPTIQPSTEKAAALGSEPGARTQTDLSDHKIRPVLGSAQFFKILEDEPVLRDFLKDRADFHEAVFAYLHFADMGIQ